MKGVKELLERILTDENFREKVKSVAKQCKTPEEGVTAMNKLGYAITVEEWAEHSKAKEGCGCHAHGELSEEDLENVSGGFILQSQVSWFNLKKEAVTDKTVLYSKLPCKPNNYLCSTILGEICTCYRKECCCDFMHTVESRHDASGKLLYYVLTPTNVDIHKDAKFREIYL